MKVINYMCNRCGKKIDPDALYSISPYRIDLLSDGCTAVIQEDIENELFEMLDNKHLCLDCLKKTLKYFNAPAVPNPEFEKTIMSKFCKVE